MKFFAICCFIAFTLLITAPALFADEVGDQRDFWIWDLSVMPPVDAQVSATCQGVGDYSYVYIEDAAWAAEDLDAGDVAAAIAAFENESPTGSIDTAKGIYEIETEVFGMPTDIDDDEKIVLFFYNVPCFGDACFDGYFRYEDLEPGVHSNQTEMLHLNISEPDPTSEYMLGVLAHEFNHMIHNPKDLNETQWLSESMAEAAMVICGYNTDTAWLNDFLHNSDESFWGDEHDANYGGALIFGTFLYNELGENIGDLVADPTDGLTSVKNVMEAVTGSAVDPFLLLAQSMFSDDIPPLSLDDLVPFEEVTDDTYSFSTTLAPGSMHFISLEYYTSQPFTIEVTGENLSGAQIVLATGNNSESPEFDLVDPNTETCRTSGDEMNLILLNSDDTVEIDYEFNAKAVNNCPDDDDDSADDDDDSGTDSGDDDDDDDDGCGC